MVRTYWTGQVKNDKFYNFTVQVGYIDTSETDQWTQREILASEYQVGQIFNSHLINEPYNNTMAQEEAWNFNTPPYPEMYIGCYAYDGGDKVSFWQFTYESSNSTSKVLSYQWVCRAGSNVNDPPNCPAFSCANNDCSECSEPTWEGACVDLPDDDPSKGGLFGFAQVSTLALFASFAVALSF